MTKRHTPSAEVRLGPSSYKQTCTVCGATRAHIFTKGSDHFTPWESKKLGDIYRRQPGCKAPAVP